MTTYTVGAGQLSSGLVVGVNDSEFVLSGGVADVTAVSGGDATISLGGIASSTLITSYGLETVSSGGTTYGTTVMGGGVEYLVGGTANAAIVGSGGIVDVETGGLASAADVSAGGRVNVLGGVAQGTVLDGGIQDVYTGSASGTVVNAGGTDFVYATALGTMVASGGVEVIEAGATDSGASLALGASIDLPSLTFVSAGSATLDAADNLTVAQGGSSVTELLAGLYAGDVFQMTQDAGRGTLVTLDSMPCFCRGTRILTARGERPVEDLAIGDHVVTATGATAAIRWIGHRGYAGRFLAGRPSLRPVVVRAGALGAGLPRRDLRLSPLHALLLEGVLVPAGQLLNGATILRDAACSSVEYVHVELARHDIILAEGAPAETFLDDDSRGLFSNAAEHAALYPDSPANRGFCARRVESGFELEAIRARLGQLAAA